MSRSVYGGRMKSDRRNRWFGVGIAVWATLLFLMVLYIVFDVFPDFLKPAAPATTTRAAQIEDWYCVTCDRAVDIVNIGEPHVEVPVEDGAAELTHTMEYDAPKGTLLTMRCCVSLLELYVNGKEVYAYNYSGHATSPHDPYATRLYQISMPALERGDVLTLKLETLEDREIPVQYMLLGNRQDIMLRIWQTQTVTLITCLSLLVFSLAEIALAVIRRVMHSKVFNRASVWMGVLIFFASLWIGSNSGLFLVLVRNDLLYYLVEMLSLMLMPISGLLYLYYSTPVRSWFLRLFCLLQMVATLVAFGLYLAGITDFDRMLPYIHAALVAVLLYMFYAVLAGKLEHNAFFLTGVLIMLLISVVSLILYYTHLFYPVSQLAKYGMLCFSICMLFYTMTNAVRTSTLAEKAAAAEARMQMVEDELFLSQISSHFFYNTMNVIRGLIKIDPEEAYRLTGNFVKYLRSHVDAIHAQGGVLPFTEELAAVKAYAEVCKVKLNGNLEIVYDLAVTNFIVPALTLEPIVENAIKHGLFPNGGGCVYISSRAEKDAYVVTVRDNGVGFDALDEGVGLSNVRRRLTRYDGCSLTVKSSSGSGTVVEIQYAKPIDIKEIFQDENDAGGR